MLRYLRLLAVQFRMSALLALQYRYDFLVDGAINAFWAFTALAPLLIVFQKRESVAGWSYGEALLVIGWFTLLEGVMEGSINPSLSAVVEHIRKGTLDFVLLKPADAQFLVSTAKIEPWHVVDVAGALVIFGVAFMKLGRWP
ncbi:MAG TPA: ABC-2 family transporter protein, partial [Myxococcaceae bacterium]|nr:ABC-2 family transporter protein [Myxococcaceae bacterium]